jgi:hypothetical protein
MLFTNCFLTLCIENFQAGYKQYFVRRLYVQPGVSANYEVRYYPSVSQRVLQLLGLYPQTPDIENAVRKSILGDQ